MSDVEKKVKKVKVVKELNYAYVPDDVWEKTLAEFVKSMDELEQRVLWLERAIPRLAKAIEMEKENG